VLACGVLAGCTDQPTAVRLPRESPPTSPLLAGSALPRGLLLLDTIVTVPAPAGAAGSQLFVPAGRFHEPVRMVLTPEWSEAEWKAPFSNLGTVGTWSGVCAFVYGDRVPRRRPSPSGRTPAEREKSVRRGVSAQQGQSPSPPVSSPTGVHRDLVPEQCEPGTIWSTMMSYSSSSIELRTGDGASALTEGWLPGMAPTDRIFDLSADEAEQGARMDYAPVSYGGSGGTQVICDSTDERCVTLAPGDDWQLSVVRLRVRVYAQAPLTCNYTPTDRGSTVACVAYGFTAGAELDWRFQEDDNRTMS